MNPAYYYDGIKGKANGRPMCFPPVDQFAAEMDDFAACVRDNKPTGMPGEEGLHDLRIIEAIYQAAATGKSVKLG